MNSLKDFYTLDPKLPQKGSQEPMAIDLVRARLDKRIESLEELIRINIQTIKVTALNKESFDFHNNLVRLSAACENVTQISTVLMHLYSIRDTR